MYAIYTVPYGRISMFTHKCINAICTCAVEVLISIPKKIFHKNFDSRKFKTQESVESLAQEVPCAHIYAYVL